MTGPNIAPLTEQITIGATETGGLTAHGWNGARKILLAVSPLDRPPFLVRDGAGLADCFGLGSISGRDILDLLAAGRCGEFSVDVRKRPMTARRDADFHPACALSAPTRE